MFYSIYLVQGPAAEIHSSDDEIVPSFQESFVDALAQATENLQIANQGKIHHEVHEFNRIHLRYHWQAWW